MITWPACLFGNSARLVTCGADDQASQPEDVVADEDEDLGLLVAVVIVVEGDPQTGVCVQVG